MAQGYNKKINLYSRDITSHYHYQGSPCTLPMDHKKHDNFQKILSLSYHERVVPTINFLGMDDEWEGQLCNQSYPLEKLAVCNEELNNEEEYEGSQMGVSFCFSHSEIFCQEEIYLLDPIEQMNDVFVEAYKEYEVLKSEILDEVVDVSPGNCHEFSLHGYFEDQFDSVQGNL